MTFKIFENDLENPKTTQPNNQNSRYESHKSVETVDVRYFGLFFSLQLFLQRSKQNFNIDTRDKNPYSVINNNSFGNFNNFTSPLSSPRGKGSSSSRTLYSGQVTEYQMIINFIKTNMKLFLRLIASDIHNTETSLNSNEFNTLKIFFKFGNETTGALENKLNDKLDKINDKYGKKNQNSSNFNHQPQQLSSIAPFFINFSTTTKINIDIINEWLNCVIVSPGQSVEIEDLIQLKNLSKCVTIKEASSIQNKNIKISQCEDSYIYINSNVLNIRIQNCNNCTIIVAAVSKITTIDKCENCNICVATNLLRVSNTIDSAIYCYSVNEPILFGDNRALVMAPHNVFYNELGGFIKNAKFPPATNTHIHNFSNPILMHAMEKEENLIFQVMNPKDFSQLTTPFQSNMSGTSNTISQFLFTPKEYVEVIKDRENKMMKVKNLILESKLHDEQEKALHVAIQGYFREWLVSSGNIKQMTDLVKMIDIPNSKTYETSSKQDNEFKII